MEDKHPKDMSVEEYKEYYFKSKYWKSSKKLLHIAKFLYILQFKFVKDSFGWQVKRRFNPYNPLTYPILLLIIIYASFTEIFRTLAEIFSELGRVFKYE